MAEKREPIRIPFNLNLDNPEHKKVYDILQRQENRNAFIRKAVLLYGDAIARDNGMLLQEFRKILRQENWEMYLQLLELFTQEGNSEPQNTMPYGNSQENLTAQELDLEQIKKMF